MDEREEPTGERFIPEAMGDQLIEAEHHARYRHAMRLVRGRAVLDAACGVGWGSALLAEAGARSVVGLDVDAGALGDAATRCATNAFVRADLTDLPFPDGCFEVITSYETIEHVDDPYRALDELRRVLAPGGVLSVSSPNPAVYPSGNPFHRHEFPPEELRVELEKRFGHVTAWQQHPMLASILTTEQATDPHSTAITLPELTMDGAMYSVFDASDAPLAALDPLSVLVSAQQFAGLVEIAERCRDQHGGVVIAPEVVAQLEAERQDLEAARDHLRKELDGVLLLLLEAEQELARRDRGDTA